MLWKIFSDMIGVPDLAAGAMENWGLITYRQQYILVDERFSTDRDKFLVVRTVAHELAHQVLTCHARCSWPVSPASCFLWLLPQSSDGKHS